MRLDGTQRIDLPKSTEFIYKSLSSYSDCGVMSPASTALLFFAFAAHHCDHEFTGRLTKV